MSNNKLRERYVKRFSQQLKLSEKRLSQKLKMTVIKTFKKKENKDENKDGEERNVKDRR